MPRKALDVPPELRKRPGQVNLEQRDWDWLHAQPQGASAAVRELVARARARDERAAKGAS